MCTPEFTTGRSGIHNLTGSSGGHGVCQSATHTNWTSASEEGEMITTAFNFGIID